MLTMILNSEELNNPIKIIYQEAILDAVNILLQVVCTSEICVNKLNKVSEFHFLKIDFTATDIPFQGQWLESEQTIKVKASLPLEKMIQTLIFELCNATNPALTKNKLRLSNFPNADSYALYIETAEHQSFLEACLLYMDILKNHPELPRPDSQELQKFRELYDDKTYLNYVKKNGHYQHYVQYYTDTQRKKNHSRDFFFNRDEQITNDEKTFSPENKKEESLQLVTPDFL
ncbi:hypothetical protein [Legionella spiritensis]|uniref:Uncharacterized protein n=1 Tax=Legionella spiritensis TaxID=452 RepID=A0A0W0Z594_LEGSP|nr:hypothetical protein [Legionella spiritensis]KTD64316.1 hypothetical protein Lspi_1123 [Legionella spiritensis]SNV46646.1 Uncharacterised protein [Legionella spiritensis]